MLLGIERTVTAWSIGWAFFAMVIAGITLYLRLDEMHRKAKLAAFAGTIRFMIGAPARTLPNKYSVGLRVVNSGRRERPHYRATFYFPTDTCEIEAVTPDHGNTANIGGPWTVGGRGWKTVEFTCGPIYRDDDDWIGNVDVWSNAGPCDVLWKIRSDDGRFPVGGEHGRIHAVFPEPPA